MIFSQEAVPHHSKELSGQLNTSIDVIATSSWIQEGRVCSTAPEVLDHPSDLYKPLFPVAFSHRYLKERSKVWQGSRHPSAIAPVRTNFDDEHRAALDQQQVYP